MDLLFFLLLLLGTYFIGTKGIERKHYREIRKRERQFLHLPAVPSKNVLDQDRVIARTYMATGSVVISIDYFKRFLAALINYFGGEMSAIETVIDRARREAILRMKETVRDADLIINVRIQTSTIGKVSRRGTIGCSEIIAYGTAITYADGNRPRRGNASSETTASEFDTSDTTRSDVTIGPNGRKILSFTLPEPIRKKRISRQKTEPQLSQEDTAHPQEEAQAQEEKDAICQPLPSEPLPPVLVNDESDPEIDPLQGCAPIGQEEMTKTHKKSSWDTILLVAGIIIFVFLLSLFLKK